MELAGQILVVLPAALALYAALRLVLRLRHDRGLGGLCLILLALQAPMSLATYLAVLQTNLSSLALGGLIGVGVLAGLGAAALMRVVRVGRRKAVRRAAWLPVPTALAVAGVQTVAVFGDVDLLGMALGALAFASGFGAAAAAGALVLLLIRHPAPAVGTVHLALPPAASEVVARYGIDHPRRQRLPASGGPAVVRPAVRPVVPAVTEPRHASVQLNASPQQQVPPLPPPPVARVGVPPVPYHAPPPAPPVPYHAPPPASPPAPRTSRKGAWVAIVSMAVAGMLAVVGTLVIVGGRDTESNRDPGASGAASTAAPSGITTGSVRWRLTDDRADLVPPAVVGGIALVGDLQGKVRGVDLATGETLWTRVFTPGLPGMPSVAGEDAYVVAGADLISLEPLTGEERWRVSTETSDAFASDPVRAGELVVTATDQVVYAVDPETGEIVWSARSRGEGLFSSLPTVAGARVLIATDRGLTALDAGTGQIVWTFETGPGEGVWSTPAVSFDRAYLAIGGRLVAIDLVTGRTLWSFAAGADDQFNETPAVSGGRVYVTDGHVYALDAETGSQLWSSDAVDPASSPAVSSTPVVDGNLLLIPAADGLYALNADTGGLAWRFNVDATSGVGVPAVGNDDVLVVSVSMNGSVAHGIDPSSGTERWRLDLAGEAHFSAPVLVDGSALLPGRSAVIAVD